MRVCQGEVIFMKLDRTENTKRNILWGTLNKAITLLLPFITRIVMNRTLGAEYLGLNSLFRSILDVLNLSELGFSSAIVYCMYEPIAKNDSDAICALLNAYRKLYKIVGAAILGIGCALLPVLPRLVHGSIPRDVNLYVVYLIYLLNTAVSYLLFAYKQALPNAFQRVDIISNITTITTGGMYCIQIVILMNVRKYYPYLILLPVSTVINNIITSLYVDRTYPEYRCRGEISQAMKAEIKEKVTGLFITRICQTTRNSLDSICTSAFLGLVVTAMYNNYYYILYAMTGIFGVIIQSMTAGVGNSIVVESREKNYNDLKKINFIFMWISGWATICMLVLYQPFIRIFYGEKYLFPESVVIEFCLYFYMLRMGDIRALYSDAAGLWWENRYRAIAESLTNIVLNIILGRMFGVHGIIIATLISLFVINFLLGSQIVFKHYFQNGKLAEYFQLHGFYLIVSALVALVTVWLCSLFSFGDGPDLLVKLIVACIVPNLLYYLIYRKTAIYRLAMPWILHKYNLDRKFRFLLK